MLGEFRSSRSPGFGALPGDSQDRCRWPELTPQRFPTQAHSQPQRFCATRCARRNVGSFDRHAFRLGVVAFCKRRRSVGDDRDGVESSVETWGGSCRARRRGYSTYVSEYKHLFCPHCAHCLTPLLDGVDLRSTPLPDGMEDGCFRCATELSLGPSQDSMCRRPCFPALSWRKHLSNCVDQC